MKFLGKITGTLLGLSTGKSFYVLIGFLLGHYFDRKSDKRWINQNISFDDFYPFPEYLVQAIFEHLGHIFKSNSRVNEDEIKITRELMSSLRLGERQISEAIKWFNHGKEKEFSINQSLHRFKFNTNSRIKNQTLFMRLLTESAISSPTFSQTERRILWSIAKELNIKRSEIIQLEVNIRLYRRSSRLVNNQIDKVILENAYNVLGVNSSSSDKEIKISYRRLMNQNHPDKIAASNPTPDELSSSEELTRNIRNAYEVIKKQRSHY